MAIDIGAAAFDFGSDTANGYTEVDKTNPANDTGYLDVMRFYVRGAVNATGCKAGTFSDGVSNSLTYRDHEVIGEITYGSIQTFTGLNCDCEIGDYLGWYISSGVFAQGAGGSGGWYKSGDYFSSGANTYSFAAGLRFSAFALGISFINVAVTAGVDPLIITEYGATVNAEVSLTAGTDALVITEYQAIVNAETNITALVDALVIMEYGATVTISSSTIIPIIMYHYHSQ